MSTLEVRAKKGLFSKSLTARLGPFVRETRLEARGIDVPTGRFLLEFRVADVNGAESVASVRVYVR